MSSGSPAGPREWIVLTLFPELISQFFSEGLLGRARVQKLISVQVISLRDYGLGPHRQVDDSPYGGGGGMILRFDVLYSAWKAVQDQAPATTLLLSPQGPVLTQEKAASWVPQSKLLLVCGHYEGVDERFIHTCVDEEVSIGNYVLSGGELAAGVVLDVIARSVPGVLQNPSSFAEDCFQGKGLKHPQYTRPLEYLGQSVPEVLLSGNHREILRYREEERPRRTARKRADLTDQT